MKLVEVVVALETSAEAVARAEEFAAAIGKTAIGPRTVPDSS